MLTVHCLQGHPSWQVTNCFMHISTKWSVLRLLKGTSPLRFLIDQNTMSPPERQDSKTFSKSITRTLLIHCAGQAELKIILSHRLPSIRHQIGHDWMAWFPVMPHPHTHTHPLGFNLYQLIKTVERLLSSSTRNHYSYQEKVKETHIPSKWLKNAFWEEWSQSRHVTAFPAWPRAPCFRVRACSGRPAGADPLLLER